MSLPSTDWAGVATLVFLLGLRHGFDPDHLVAIDGLGQSEYMVRVARRLAERRDAPWTVVTVQTGVADEARQQELDQAFALARKLGADTEVLRGASDLLASSLSSRKNEAAQAVANVEELEEQQISGVISRLQSAIAAMPSEHFERLESELARELGAM